MRALLDANVLIALLDAAHVHHGLAVNWLTGHIGVGWSSSPITQNGCIRILSQPRYPSPLPAVEVAQRLAEAAAQPEHEFWADDISLLDARRIHWPAVLGHRQVTDAYLLALAVAHSGRFVTLDRRVDLRCVPGAAAEHMVSLV